MYYLFMTKPADLARYKREFMTVAENRAKGITPVFNQLRAAKTLLAECIPFNLINAFFLTLASVAVNKLALSDVVKIAAVLIMNSVCGAIAQYIFAIARHRLRIKLCRRLHIDYKKRYLAGDAPQSGMLLSNYFLSIDVNGSCFHPGAYSIY